MSKLLVSLFLLALLGSAPVQAAPAHDLFLCASINKDYVIGSKLITLSGLYRREADGSYQHLGVNFPGIFSLSFDPRDHDVFYAASLNGVLCTRDGGKTWRIGTSWDMTEPKDVFVDPNAPDHIYLALPDGIAVSRDRGATWPRRDSRKISRCCTRATTPMKIRPRRCMNFSAS